MGSVFPRSKFAAAMEGATHSARTMHDERIGKGKVFHLFRLPVAMEQSIHHILMGEDYHTLCDSISDDESALKVIRSLVDSTVDASDGPVQIGLRKDLGTKFSVAELAKHYLSAFESDRQTFPYFVDE